MARRRGGFLGGWLFGALSGGAFGLSAAALVVAVRLAGMLGAWEEIRLLPADAPPNAAASAVRLPDAPGAAVSAAQGASLRGAPVFPPVPETECDAAPAGVPTLFLTLRAERLAVFEGEPLRCGRLRELLGVEVPDLSGPAAVELARGVPFQSDGELWQVLEGLQAESWQAGQELAPQLPNNSLQRDE